MKSLWMNHGSMQGGEFPLGPTLTMSVVTSWLCGKYLWAMSTHHNIAVGLFENFWLDRILLVTIHLNMPSVYVLS